MTAKDYNKLVSEVSGWRGAYPLIVRMRVGDYYELRRDGVPRYLGNAFNWPGWTENTAPVDSEPVKGSWTYSSGCERRTGPSARAGVRLPGGLGIDATLSLSFTHSAGFVLAHDAGTHSVFRDVDSVRRSVLNAARDGWWQKHWILVTEVIAAESATLAVATKRRSQIDLYANAAIPADIAGVAIAKPSLGWTASGWRGSGYSSICQSGTPLYHCLRLRRRLFGDWRGELLDDAAQADLFTDDPFDPDT
jgi:hypothetical protein